LSRSGRILLSLDPLQGRPFMRAIRQKATAPHGYEPTHEAPMAAFCEKLAGGE